METTTLPSHLQLLNNKNVTFTDPSLKHIGLTARVSGLRDAYFRAMPEICIERPKLVTEWSKDKDHNLFNKDKITSLDKAKLYNHVLHNLPAVVWHKWAMEQIPVTSKGDDGKTTVKKEWKPFAIEERSLFAGSTTSRFKGVPLYPEFIASWIWPELETLKDRQRNPYSMTVAEGDILNKDIFPFWIDNNITELTRSLMRKENNCKHDPQEFKLLQNLVFFLTTKANCISHTIPSFKEAINNGLGKIINDAESHKAATDNPEIKEFYEAMILALKGVIAYSKRLAKEANRLAEQTQNDIEKRELQELARIHDRVPEYPATTLREGLTTIWMCWIALHVENANAAMSLGRLDQILWDLYQKDVKNHHLSDVDAVELLCCFWLKIGDHVPMVPNTGEQLFGGTGSNQAITIGGVTEVGKDAVNDLTYLILRAIELMRLRDPNLNARYDSEQNDDCYLHRLCEVNLETGATPALHNDQAVIASLLSTGVENLKQANDYGIVGCVEPISAGRTYGHTGAILINLTSVLDLTLFGGRHRLTGLDQEPFNNLTPDVSRLNTIEDLRKTFNTFEDFQKAFIQQAQWLIDKAITLNNYFGRIHQNFHPTPILSSLFEGPMDKGLDLIFGGATVNSSGIAMIGLADVVDSLASIKHWMFDDQSLSPRQLFHAMDVNFENDKDALALYAKLRNHIKSPKYGNDGKVSANNIASWLVQELDKYCKGKTNYRHGNYRVGYWSMTNHAGFGKLTESTPNGRRKGVNFSSGITPVSGMTSDINAVLNSVSSLPSEYLPNGIALNISYPPAVLQGGDPEQNKESRKKMLDAFTATVKQYFKPKNASGNHGGMEIQFNITNYKILREAQANPEEYKDLLVRVSGYTAYFKDLNLQMQEEIIERTEYSLWAGQAVNIVNI